MSVSTQPPAHRVLCFVSMGDEHSAVRTWLEQAPGVADVAIAAYGKNPVPEDLKRAARYFLVRRDFKVPNFLALLDAEPGLLDRYDGVFFIDDDIRFAPGGLQRFLGLVRQHGLAWAQPSFDTHGDVHYRHMAHRPGAGVVREDFLEVGLFFISTPFLVACLPWFARTKTGAGLDYAMMVIRHRTGVRAAVIHDVVVDHPHRPRGATIRDLTPRFREEAEAIIDAMKRDLNTPVDLASVSLMSRLFGHVRFEWLMPLQAARQAVRRVKASISPHKAS